MALFKFYANTGLVGSEIEEEFEVPDEELAGKTPEQRDALLTDYAREILFENIEWGFVALNADGTGERP